MMNDGVNICSRACAVCWDTKLPIDYDKRAEYIGKRTRIGHTSVIEHSNTVFLLPIDISKDGTDLMVFLSECRYLHTIFRLSKKNPSIGYLLIGGSWRAFADIFYFSSNLDNAIALRVIDLVRTYIPYCGMSDIINYGILEKEDFKTARIDEMSSEYNLYKNRTYSIDKDYLDCINCDNLDMLIKNIQECCAEPEVFTVFDLLDFCTITVNFMKMSRIITQQLTRHRNGITQESQRYVNYAKSCFNSPAEFKDKYDPNHKYEIMMGSTRMNLTLQELGDMMVKVYGQLTDNTNPRTKDFALAKEDARGYLPNNTQCGTIYITFTWRTFFKFLELREDTHAQAEIREYALALGEWFRNEFGGYSTLYDALKPRCINDSEVFMASIGNINTNNIDERFEEVVDELEEAVKNFDESKVDPEEVEETEPNQKHGEM